MYIFFYFILSKKELYAGTDVEFLSGRDKKIMNRVKIANQILDKK